MDGESFEAIELQGVEAWLDELREELRKKSYTPEAVLRVWIPKPNGEGRPLGIPTIRDRVVQTATVLVLEPIFEADLQPQQKKAVQRVCRGISETTSRRWGLMSVESRVERLNRLMIGWANYFYLGPVSRAYAAVDSHARRRLRQWLRRKHKIRGSGSTRFPDTTLHQELGLAQLSVRTRNFPWANA